ncbi:multidrug efflux SMR transporter [Gordonia sp. 'Campus']|uniref:DMT family transporter n=1 Tax=Gordonia sp. 'Campus' TaxID=2915824 RepID=UPI001EE4D7FC|nr:SMR family transporter [Gordonia sp. 'Campus']
MGYVFLVVAIIAEVSGTLALRAAAGGRPRFYAVVVVGYAVAFAALTLGLRNGVPLGVAYGIWAATGVAVTAVAAHFLFRERLNRRMVAGIGIIILGVLLVELGALH